LPDTQGSSVAEVAVAEVKDEIDRECTAECTTSQLSLQSAADAKLALSMAKGRVDAKYRKRKGRGVPAASQK
jgi:hypothetical protein